MFTFTEEDLERFLKGEPFYKNQTCYSLGDNLEDAGEIYRQLLIERNETNVGMVCKEDN